MANALNADLHRRVVLLPVEFFKEGYRDGDRRFICLGGYGCLAQTIGTKVFGKFLRDPPEEPEYPINGYDIERFATEEEVPPAEVLARYLKEESRKNGSTP